MSDDENLANIRDLLPPMWYSMYQGCLDAGFNREQAFNLLQTYILGNGHAGVRPNRLDGPPSNKG